MVADILGIMLVADKVLTAREHCKRRVGRLRLDGAQALPRILVKEAQAGVERGAAPCFDSPITYAVHLRQNRQHVADRHARRPQALLAVTDCRVHDLESRHDLAPLLPHSKNARRGASMRPPSAAQARVSALWSFAPCQIWHWAIIRLLPASATHAQIFTGQAPNPTAKGWAECSTSCASARKSPPAPHFAAQAGFGA